MVPTFLIVVPGVFVRCNNQYLGSCFLVITNQRNVLSHGVRCKALTNPVCHLMLSARTQATLYCQVYDSSKEAQDRLGLGSIRV
jgi:hypothetical protein